MILNVGVDYHTMSVEDREFFFLNSEKLEQTYAEITPRFPETVFLSTCNRMEVFFSGQMESSEVMIEWMISKFIPEGTSTKKIKELKSKFYQHRGSGAARHLLEVAAGLHSMVIGENQILHQIKRAYREAQIHQNLEAEFHKLFQSALSLGKKVRTHTDIGKGGMSLGSVSVDIIKKLYEKDSQFSVTLIGAGEIAEEVLKSLHHHGQVKVWICNRDAKRAQKLLNRYQNFMKVDYIPFEKRYQIAQESNVTVVSTNAPEFVLTKEEMEKTLGGRHRFSFFIDLSVPRNIDPKISEIQDLVVYSLDDLDKIISENYSQRSSQVNECHHIIDEQLQDFEDWRYKRKFFLVKREWEKLLVEINRERQQNHQKLIPEENLKNFFKEQYQRFCSQGEIDLFIPSQTVTRDLLIATLDTLDTLETLEKNTPHHLTFSQPSSNSKKQEEKNSHSL